MRKTGAIVVALAAATAAAVVATSGALPERVASHFDAAGHANGWMTRDGYVAFMIAFVVGLPLFVSLFVPVLVRRYPGLTNVPHRDHWLAPERSAESLDWLVAHMRWLGAVTVVFSGGLHALVVLANRQTPPRLDPVGLVALMAIFTLAIGAWVVVLYRRFGSPS